MVKHHFETMRVLLVDTDPPARAQLRANLQSLGVRNIAESEDYGQSWFGLVHSPADIIFLDWGADGVECLKFTRKLRAEPNLRFRYTPLVVLSRTATPQHIKSAGQAGASGFLVKPVSADVLLHRLNSLVGNAPKRV